MSREIKFREWVHGKFHYWGFVNEGSFHGPATPSVTKGIHQQFTGLLDKNGVEIYDGDIFRVEEDAEDLIYYLVILWVQEWAMFCTLRVDDEYTAYLNGGVKELDEPMFWTYTLEDTNDRRFFLCGNIYANPELLKP